MEGDKSGVKGVKEVKWREMNLELKELKKWNGVKTNVLWAAFMLISHVRSVPKTPSREYLHALLKEYV